MNDFVHLILIPGSIAGVHLQALTYFMSGLWLFTRKPTGAIAAMIIGLAAGLALNTALHMSTIAGRMEANYAWERLLSERTDT